MILCSYVMITIGVFLNDATVVVHSYIVNVPSKVWTKNSLFLPSSVSQ